MSTHRDEGTGEQGLGIITDSLIMRYSDKNIKIEIGNLQQKLRNARKQILFFEEVLESSEEERMADTNQMVSTDHKIMFAYSIVYLSLIFQSR